MPFKNNFKISSYKRPLGIFSNRCEFSLIGSSAAVYSVLIFICSYFPNNKVNLILFSIELKYIGIVYVLLSLIQIPIENPGGNIAHLGGAIYGFYYAKNYNTYKTPLDIFFKGFKKINVKPKNKIDNQVEIDKILDKISRSGYESLSKKEKEFLFKNSDKN